MPAGAVQFIPASTIDPADTCAGVDGGGISGNHLITPPTEGVALKDQRLVVFIGGATSKPGDYETITQHAADLGYAVINLAYPNPLVDPRCGNSDACYRQLRGEILFGENTPYSTTAASNTRAGTRYNDDGLGSPGNLHIDRANSIVNRLVCVINYLAGDFPVRGEERFFWAGFLSENPDSPYVAARTGGPLHYYPDWSKIILAGHSSGAGMAGFLGVQLPPGNPLRRVLLFSGPQDHTTIPATNTSPAQTVSASWITEVSTTPLSRFWGLRSSADVEGDLGDFVEENWLVMGRDSVPSPNGIGGTDHNVRTGLVNASAAFGESQHLFIYPDPPEADATPSLRTGFSALENHNNTAVDFPNIQTTKKRNRRESYTGPIRSRVWSYFFTASSTD